MKHSIFKNLLLLFGLLIMIQNGAIIIHNPGSDAGNHSAGNMVTTYSDLPPSNDNYS